MDVIAYGSLKVQPIKEGFGAEVSGVDWSKVPLDEETIKTLVQIQDRFGVIFFRNTGLDNERHIAFSKQFGELEVKPIYYGKEKERLDTVYLFDVGNIEADGSLVKRDSRRWHHSKGNALWHTDSSYHQNRSKYSMLLAYETPKSGGADTQFADTRRAYADLPQEKRDEIKDYVIEHDLWHSRKMAAPQVYNEITEYERTTKPPAYHKLVQKTADGRETLYIAAHAKTILGKSFEESQKIIWELIDHCTQPKYTFSFSWCGPGDMAWWDNRISLHKATAFNDNMERRDVRRSTIIDDGPLSHGVSVEERIAAGLPVTPN